MLIIQLNKVGKAEQLKNFQRKIVTNRIHTLSHKLIEMVNSIIVDLFSFYAVGNNFIHCYFMRGILFSDCQLSITEAIKINEHKFL